MKSYTDLEQSKKLAEILPLETADMFYADLLFNRKHKYISHNLETYGFKTFEDTKTRESANLGFIPCWSLAALIGVLPAECECMSLEHINYGNNHKKYFMSYIGGENTEDYDNPVDACVAMILKLHELKIL